MATVSTPESILIADCGAVATKIALVDRVGSDYRLIGVARAVTTVEPPFADLSVGVRRAISQLEMLTGRALLTTAGELITPEQVDGTGVDAFVGATSAALPLRCAVVGLSRDFSVAAAQRALASTDSVVEMSIAVDEESGRWGTTARDGRTGGPSAAVEKLAASQLDVIVMVGGVDGGATVPLLELANIVASIGEAMDEGQRPLVLFAGNREARAAVAERIGSTMEFRAVDNALPALDFENHAPLQAEIESIFAERKLQAIPGLATLNGWSARPILPTLTGYERVAHYLARRYDLRVQALDLGGATLGWVYADSSCTRRALLPDMGMGYGLDRLVTRVGLESIGRWLPPSQSLETAHAWLLNQALRPWTIPMQSEERTVLNAAAREAAVLSLSAQPADLRRGADLVLLSGAPLARGGKPGALLMLALDALDVRGIFSVAADLSGIVPGLGALAAINPQAAAQVLERDGPVTLGTALVVNSAPHSADGPALWATVETPKGGKFEVQVASGECELIPLGPGEKASVEIRAARDVDLGLRSQGTFKRDIEGGTVGLVLDARGRPIPLTGTLEEQRARSHQWLSELGAG